MRSDKPLFVVRAALMGAAVFSLFSVLPLVAERWGVMFLPDPAILTQWRIPVLSLVGGLTVVLFAALLATPSRGRLFSVLRLLTPVVYALIFYVGVTTALPMAWTYVAGTHSVKVVTVASPAGLPTSRCRPAVQLQNMPILFDRLCNVPHGLLSQLSPGDKVLLIGKGSRLGMFYENARLLPVGVEL